MASWTSKDGVNGSGKVTPVFLKSSGQVILIIEDKEHDRLINVILEKDEVKELVVGYGKP